MRPYILLLGAAFATSLLGCSHSTSPEVRLVAQYAVTDSLGTTKNTFGSSEAITLTYTVFNHSDHDISWTSGMPYPLCRFTVQRADSVYGDSFYGLAFVAIPVGGKIVAGGSAKATWRVVAISGTLSLGEYTAVAEPMWYFPDPDGLKSQQLTFSITR